MYVSMYVYMCVFMCVSIIELTSTCKVTNVNKNVVIVVLFLNQCHLMLLGVFVFVFDITSKVERKCSMPQYCKHASYHNGE